MYKVCLVEDEPDLRELLVDWMRSCKRLQLIDAYGTGEEALRELPRDRPDVVLMDIKLPGMSGIECLVALRHLVPPFLCPVLMLTGYADEELVLDALKAGADGYLLKRDASGKKLQAAVVEVMAGGGPMSPSIAHQVLVSFQVPPAPHSSASGPQPSAATALTLREQQVLKLATQGLAYKEIAASLNISLDTVRKHLRSLYYKLHVHSRSDPRLYAVSRQHME